MAIGYDTTNVATHAISSGATLTFSHTCTGSQRFLVVEVDMSTNGAGAPTGVTYNGVAMTLMGTIFSYGQVWYLANPASGANNVVVDLNNTIFYRVYSRSYTGVAQTSPIDSFLNTNASSTTSVTAPTTVVASNCWLLGFGINGGPNTATQTIGSNRTDRNGKNNAVALPTDANSSIADSNGTIATGSQSIIFSQLTGANSFNSTFRAMAYSIKPYVAVGPANLKSLNTNLVANIKSANTNLIANTKSYDTNV